jgi:Glycoside-hydrolase family GH114/N-terminal glycosyl-hydrolase-114-associated domain
MLRNTCQSGRRILGRFVSPRFSGSSIAAVVAVLGKGRKSFTVPSIVVLLTLTCGLQAQTLSGLTYSEWRISPASITIEQGSYAGSVSALNTKDQTGTQNTPSLYVQFGTPSGQQFTGYLSFTVPVGVTLSQITSIQLMANVRAPQDTVDSWNYSIYNWKNAAYEHLGNQNYCGGSTGLHTCKDDSGSFLDWRWNQYNAIGDAVQSDYVNATTREIRIQLASSNASSYEDIDWMSAAVYTSKGTGTLFYPPADYRWEYQLTASAADGTSYPSTQGIATAVCAVPYTGGACVEPLIIDFDFYESSSISGTNNFVYATGAVNSLHSMNKKAIGYVDAGDAEQGRPDYQQYVDFDNACAGCLIGSPFSGFRSEYMLNINNDKGQADFIRKMVAARTDRVAANGFDAVEYDVLANYENKSGFTITDATQASFNISLATIAHNHFLSVPLKSDVDQATESPVESAVDFVIDEQCNQYGQCGNYSAWQAAGKAIFNVEYKLATSKFCPPDNSININGILKNYSLDVSPYTPCR